MLKAHRVGLYEDEGLGFKWALVDTDGGEVMFGSPNHPLPELIVCWCRKHRVEEAKLDVAVDGREYRPFDFARLVMGFRDPVLGETVKARRKRNGRMGQ